MNVKTIWTDKKICVLIATYNNGGTLERILRDVLAHTGQVIVVNDGSTDETENILRKFQDIDVVDYPENKGKGHALKKGFKRALTLGYDYAISIDADGQHFADDLPVLVEAIEKHPESIIIGRRNMDQQGIPGKSNFGRRFSNFWFEFETGIKLEDTQSGLRVYPIRRLKDIRFITQRFEFEVEVLVRSAWAGVPIAEVPVRVYYPPPEKRVSHFRPFKDFSRISVLNTVLVTITIFYIWPRRLWRLFSNTQHLKKSIREALFAKNESDLVKSASVGFGVFMGIFPIWGFQLVTAIALAFLFRLNKPLVILSANISIPPLIPVILFLSHITGAVWLGENAQWISFDHTLTLELLQANFLQYLIGAVTLSIVCGLAFALGTNILLKIIRPRV